MSFLASNSAISAIPLTKHYICPLDLQCRLSIPYSFFKAIITQSLPGRHFGSSELYVSSISRTYRWDVPDCLPPSFPFAAYPVALCFSTWFSEEKHGRTVVSFHFVLHLFYVCYPLRTKLLIRAEKHRRHSFIAGR